MPADAPSWSPRDYLKFERERTLPSRDLVARIELESPATIADLGCGPGNSTAILRKRWSGARIWGVDNSPAMLEAAKRSSAEVEWVLADIGAWNPRMTFDLLFSNAALQWVPDHTTLVPRLFLAVSPGGAFAVQMPARDGAWTRIIEEIAGYGRWADRFSGVPDLAAEPLDLYYDLLSPLSSRIDLWETEYVHVLSSPLDVVEWTKGTALRPHLERLHGTGEREAFLEEYTAAIRDAYPSRPDGKVLFPFHRRFWVAYR
ncbi:MAG: methyltransferase domain-containing protein [Nitrososphaerales archaeon]